MIALIQRVKQAGVEIDKEVISEIDNGISVFLGIMNDDTEDDAEYLAGKVLKLRIFGDRQGKMNLSLNDISGDILVVSQFTLCADTKKGNSPSFSKAAGLKKAEQLYNYFIDRLKESNLRIKTGRFAEHMQVSILNDGPVTFILDSKKDKK